MPNFPTNAVSTANVDQRTDSIRLARADIKSCVDNINDLIDCFDIQSPQSGEVLVAQPDGRFANQEFSSSGGFGYFVLSNTDGLVYDSTGTVTYNSGTGVADLGGTKTLLKIKGNQSSVTGAITSITVTDEALYYVVA